MQRLVKITGGRQLIPLCAYHTQWLVVAWKFKGETSAACIQCQYETIDKTEVITQEWTREQLEEIVKRAYKAEQEKLRRS